MMLKLKDQMESLEKYRFHRCLDFVRIMKRKMGTLGHLPDT